jgi:import inner membrane translocase subunit TIM23
MSFTSFLSDRQGPSNSDQQTATSAQLFQSTSFQSTASPSSSSSAPSPATAAAPTASDLFTTSAFDPAKLHPLAGLGDNLDYLLLDEDKVADLPGGQSALPSRGWTDELCYGTGTTYVSGEFCISLRRQRHRFGCSVASC